MSNLTDEHGEVRELTTADFAKFKPMSEVDPELQQHLLADQKKRKRGERGKQTVPTKVPVTIRLNSDVVDHFRSQGKGWQGRLDKVLIDYVTNTKTNG